MRIRLEIFDFDGTLFDTLGPDRGIPHWEAAHGVQYPHKGRGWWGKPESLDLALPFVAVADTHAAHAAASDCKRVLITNRIEDLGEHVKGVVKKAGLEFDAFSFASPYRSRDKRAKDVRARQFAIDYGVTEVVVYEDDPSHAKVYTDSAESGKFFEGTKVEHLTVHYVTDFKITHSRKIERHEQD